MLRGPNLKPGEQPRLMNWTAHAWPGYSGWAANRYELGPFVSGSTPPVVSPADFALYGYGSCTAWAKFLASALKAVGVPAREVGAPCWNTGTFRGLAAENPGVADCWAGGPPGGPSGGAYLHNHNWVEYWDNVARAWRFLDVAVSSASESTWFCGSYSDSAGCRCDSPAGKAGKDHEVQPEIKAPETEAEGPGGLGPSFRGPASALSSLAEVWGPSFAICDPSTIQISTGVWAKQKQYLGSEAAKPAGKGKTPQARCEILLRWRYIIIVL